MYMARWRKDNKITKLLIKLCVSLMVRLNSQEFSRFSNTSSPLFVFSTDSGNAFPDGLRISATPFVEYLKFTNLEYHTALITSSLMESFE